MDVINGMKFGLGEYTKSGFIKTINKLNNKSTFGKKGSDTYESAAFFIVITLVVISIVLGFMAVPKIAPGSSDRAKNIRVGLYAILLLTEGRVGWIYLGLWLLNANLFS